MDESPATVTLILGTPDGSEVSRAEAPRCDVDFVDKELRSIESTPATVGKIHALSFDIPMAVGDEDGAVQELHLLELFPWIEGVEADDEKLITLADYFRNLSYRACNAVIFSAAFDRSGVLKSLPLTHLGHPDTYRFAEDVARFSEPAIATTFERMPDLQGFPGKSSLVTNPSVVFPLINDTPFTSVIFQRRELAFPFAKSPWYLILATLPEGELLGNCEQFVCASFTERLFTLLQPWEPPDSFDNSEVDKARTGNGLRAAAEFLGWAFDPAIESKVPPRPSCSEALRALTAALKMPSQQSPERRF